MPGSKILHLVRKGYALATPEQVDVVAGCPEVRAEGKWVPRWALEAEASLEDCGITPDELRRIFGLGKDSVVAELEAMVLSGKRANVLESRDRYRPARIDLLTDAALTGALWQHREACAACKNNEPCSSGADLQDELEQLFPNERRKIQRA